MGVCAAQSLRAGKCSAGPGTQQPSWALFAPGPMNWAGQAVLSTSQMRQQGVLVMCPRSLLEEGAGLFTFAQAPVLRPLSSVPAGGRVLQIPLVRAEDAGRYSCKASNEVGEDWLHYELMVLSEWWPGGWGWGCLRSAGPMRAPLKGGCGGEHVQSGSIWRLTT